MRILLVRPPRMKQTIAIGEFMYSEPIGLEMVYSMLNNEHTVEIFDLMSEKTDIEDKLREFNPDIVGVTSLCIDVKLVLQLTGRVKAYNSNIITFVGGTQAFLNPQAFFCSSVDHVFKFTTRDNMKAFMDNIKSCKKQSNAIENSYIESCAGNEALPFTDGICSRVNGFKTTNVHCVNEYIHPDRASTAKYRHNYSYFGYKPCAIMGTAQGCSKHCSFCLRWRIEGAVEKYFPMEFVMEEVRSIKEDSIMIFDNDFLHNGERLEEFCSFLQRENIKKNFICYGSVHAILNNKQAVKRFGDLGLKAVIIGYETFKEEELKSYSKKSSLEDNLEACRYMKEIKLDVWASFMIHPDWDAEDFKRFRKYIALLRPQIATCSPLTPFPNLPMYKEYEDRLLFVKEDYELWSFGQVAVRPSKMTLRNYYYEILKTNIYINFVSNSIFYLIKKFGLICVFRLGKGSILLFLRYIKLMMSS
jgi:hopanoid C-3 methylase